VSGYVLSVDAELDLEEIWEYIAADNCDAADRWIGRLFDAFEALAQTPGAGHRREDLTTHPALAIEIAATTQSRPANAVS
jgi:plasmid stabilization system protein ParE